MIGFSRPNARVTTIRAALRRSRLAFKGVAAFTLAVNLLALTGSLYMLQVYDRVIPSRSLPTLVGLTLLMFGLFCAHGLLDFVRGRVLSRIGARLDADLRAQAFDAVLVTPLRARSGIDATQAVRDVDAIRAFLSGLGPTALFDIPWMPLYLGLIFFLHPLLGWLAAAGALLLVALTLLAEMRTSGPARAAATSAAARGQFMEQSRRNAEVVRALGMGEDLTKRWHGIAGRHLDDQLRSSDVALGLSTVSKVFRMLLQSAVLGLGAYIVIQGEATGGVMIAASIMTSRALAPIEVAIAHWKGFTAARQARHRLEKIFEALPDDAAAIDLPPPQQTLSVQNLFVAPPGQNKPIVQNMTFDLAAGDGLGIIGPSASGKSSLARALVGAWLPVPGRGSVRLDGAPLEQWQPRKLGRHIGYLPQDIELFDGTVAENIARFDAAATSDAIIAAARTAGVHDLILNLSEGYGTRIGERGSQLSAGQRQRIALARALFGEPFLVVLDEPNSNLDAPGEIALADAIRSVRARGGIAIIIAHRPSALGVVDKLLAMANGQLQSFGSKEEVLRKVTQPVAALPGRMKIVSDHGSGLET